MEVEKNSRSSEVLVRLLHILLIRRSRIRERGRGKKLAMSGTERRRRKLQGAARVPRRRGRRRRLARTVSGGRGFNMYLLANFLMEIAIEGISHLFLIKLLYFLMLKIGESHASSRWMNGHLLLLLLFCSIERSRRPWILNGRLRRRRRRRLR